MAAKQHLDQLRKQIEKLRSDSIGVVASANKIVYGGVQKLADRELKALNDYYKSALASIKSANKGDLRGLANQQLDLLQDTVNQVISHARESMSIVADTRAELARLVQKGVDGEKIAVSRLDKAVAPAKKAVNKAKSVAQKASKDAGKTVSKARSAAQKAGKDAGKTVSKVRSVAEKAGKDASSTVSKVRSVAQKATQDAEKTVKKATEVARKAVAEGKATAVAAAKKVEYAFPAPSANSRASRATSKAKQAAGAAIDTVGNAVNNVTSTVSGAVSKIAEAVKSQG